jgi:hypothetical protein
MNLNNSHLDFILADIKRRGVSDTSLQEDVLDHICCFLEKECETDDFQTSYQLALRSLGSLRVLQTMTSVEIDSHGIAAVFYKCFDYVFTIIFLAFGLGCFGFPLSLLVFYVNIPAFAALSPLMLLGYFICFTRINFRKFELIPFKTRVFPDELIFS